MDMLLATWNLNNRVGKVRFRPEAAQVAAQIGADVVVLTEFYPGSNFDAFRHQLNEHGYDHVLASNEGPELANRVLIASRLAFEPHSIRMPAFDRQFPSNLLAVRLKESGLAILGVRVPAYSHTERTKLLQAWGWLEEYARDFRAGAAVIAGDLNTHPTRHKGGGAVFFRRVLESGWSYAEPTEPTFVGHGGASSCIDHILAAPACELSEARVVRQVQGTVLAGAPGAVSDHFALTCRLRIGNAT